MSDITKYVLTATVSALTIVVSSVVWAGGGTIPINVPEPGLFGIVAAGVAAVVVAARMSRKSK